MPETDARTLANLKKRRGVARASLTRLGTKVGELEGATDNPDTLDHAKRLTTKLEVLDAEYKTHHYAIVDLTDDETALLAEQETLDAHDESVAQLGIRLEHLITACAKSPDSNPHKIATKQLARLKNKLSSVDSSIASLSSDDDNSCLLKQHQEQLSEFKKELSDVRNSLLSLDLEDDDEVLLSQSDVEKAIFDCSLNIKKLLHTPTSTSPPASGVKLPKLDVPTFNGDILMWKTFWEQFCISVHDRSNLSDSEKLVYLQHAFKDGTAKRVIEGLSRSGEHYTEAIKSLKSRYDRPRLIHQTHVRMIVEAPSLKDGSGKELRRLHDTIQQHLRALKALGHEPSPAFITSMLELKLDVATTFEWQKHSQSSTDVPPYHELLEFIDLRAQASEASASDPTKKAPRNELRPTSVKRMLNPSKPVASHAASADAITGNCVLCKSDKHPLYICSKFKALPHDKMISTLRSNGLCLNCLRPGHFVRDCRSVHRCKKCQNPHHTLLHIEAKEENPSPVQGPPNLPNLSTTTPIPTHAAMGIKSNLLLMTCRVLVNAPDGSSVEARALLDSASSTSFVSERLAQGLRLPRSHQSTRISGVAGLSCNSSTQHITTFKVSSLHSPSKKIDVTAVVVPRVTCDLPLHPVPLDPKWDHLTHIQLADPGFGIPGKIDLLLGVEVFVEVLRYGRRLGAPGSPVAFETEFGWVLAGGTDSCSPTHQIITHHTSLLCGDDILRQFWEIEEKPMVHNTLTPDERLALDHFKIQHSRLGDGRFLVPLPKKPGAQLLGESRSQAVRRFISFERSLHSRGHFGEFEAVIDEYFQAGHAERVPASDLEKPTQRVFYLPMHAVRKESSTTTKVRAVFDASAKSQTGVSLNDILLVGPTVTSPLIDVLLRFRLHRIALTTDISRMYRAITLTQSDRDLHRFVWRKDPSEPLKDYRMTRVTFGVSASSFVANMCVKQNAVDLASKYPLAARVVDDSFYVDDGLTGADTIDEAIELHDQLQSLFGEGGFLLRKWNSSEPSVLQHIEPELRDSQSIHPMPDPNEYTKTLGIDWNAGLDHFRITISDFPHLDNLTKRTLVSDIAKTFDVLGWVSPAIIKSKIFLQRLWEEKVDWDDPVPSTIHEAWSQWRSELNLLSEHHIPRCYFPKNSNVVSMQLHGFSDASEQAYAGVVYLRTVDSAGCIHTSLVMSKTKVAPIKRLTIPRLELCGAHLLAQVLHHCKEVFSLSLKDVFAWTDSTIVLNWLTGNPRRFKTYVGNRVSSIMELIAPDRWSHVNGSGNPADCASRGLFPSELLNFYLWWDGPRWLKLSPGEWPKQCTLPPVDPSQESGEICLHTAVIPCQPVMSLEQFSSFTRLLRVTAWLIRFSRNCRARKNELNRITGPLSVQELNQAKTYWISVSQKEYFAKEIKTLQSKARVPQSSSLLSLNPLLDEVGLLRVGGRESNSKLSYQNQHPLIIHGKHPLTKLLIRSEHNRLLHAGPTLLTASLCRQLHIVGCRKVVRSITRSCAICRRRSARPQPPLMGQLPMERITPDAVFDKVGIDFAGPIYMKKVPCVSQQS